MIINPNNIEKWCFDYFEGNLTSLERIEFERFILEHPEHHAEFEAWKDAADSDDDRVPAYLGAEALLVGIPFYATFAFKLSVGLIATLALGILGYLQWNGQVEKEYVANTNNVEMIWSPEEHQLAMVKYTDYAYGDYDVKTVTTTNQITNYVYESQTEDQNEGNNNNEVTFTDPTLFEYAVNANTYSNTELDVNNATNVYSDELAIHSGTPIDEELIMAQGTEAKDSYEEDDKSLYEHLGIDHSKYQFLNFNNAKVKGLGSKYASSGKNKHGKNKNDNQANITQNVIKNGKGGGGYKKKSHFFQNFKQLKLGLSNINDPIAVAPNTNIVWNNPALAGQLGVTRLKMNFRNQWWNTDQSFYRGVAYLDTYIEKIQAGVAYGTEYNMTADGNQSISKHTFTYAQKISLSRDANLSVGLTYEMAKGASKSTLGGMSEFYANSPISSNSLENKWKSNLGVSSWYSGKYFFGGINVTNLLGNTFIATHEGNSSYINKINLSVQVGTDYKQSMFAKTVVSPFIQYNKVGDYNDLWLGSVFRIRGFVLGGSVATSKSAKALIGVQGNKIRFTISSDYSKSLLLGNYSFSHELSMRILLGNKNNNWSRYDY